MKLRGTSSRGFIATEDDVRRAVRALRRRCAHIRRIHDLTGDPPLRRYPAGFEGLSRIVVGQQLSIASAEAIWARTRIAVSPFTAAQLQRISDASLSQAGLSRGKISTLRALAGHIADGSLAIDALATAPENEVHAALTAVKGIGPWTADIFLLFCAGRADAWAAGDLALQVAAQMALRLDERPDSEQLREIAERWRPHRATAARLLWSYYKLARGAVADAALAKQ